MPKIFISQSINAAQSRLGGYANLARSIEKASPLGTKIDRRKLKAIAEGAEFTISLKELVALDKYFSLHGDGLADRPLFVRDSVLQGLAENEKMIFLVGAFPRDEEERNDVSLWDVKAYREILSGVRRYREGVQSTLQDVLFLDGNSKHNQNRSAFEKILKEPRQSVCAIASPKANVGSEVLLAEMFEVKPFVRAKKPLPFQFYWSREDERRDIGFASAFVIDRKELMEKRTEKGRPPNDKLSGALIVNDAVYEVVPRKRGEWDDFGVIAVQKRQEGRVRLVVAGISGLTTEATAKAVVKMLNATIPEAANGENSRVLWAAIKAKVKEKKSGIGDVREYDSVEFMGKPESWPTH